MHESKVILLVEDDADDEHLTLRALRKHNVMNEVVVVCDGQQALDYLYRQGVYAGSNYELPSLIILDLNLPRVNGLELLQHIRSNAQTSLIPVVVFTSNYDATWIDKAYASGANSYVVKPTEPAEFSDVVLNIAMYWLLLNQIQRPVSV